MGAFTAVAKGTHAEPKLIVLRYEGGGERAAPRLRRQGRDLRHRRDLAQARAKMSEMKFDMCGGAAVLEAMGAIAGLGSR